MNTPWGISQDVEPIEGLLGVTWVSTSSHGGFRLSAARDAQLIRFLAAHDIDEDSARMGYEPGWWEEDCCALAVVACWPAYFPYPGQSDAERGTEALAMLRHWTDARVARRGNVPS